MDFYLVLDNIKVIEMPSLTSVTVSVTSSLFSLIKREVHIESDMHFDPGLELKNIQLTELELSDHHCPCIPLSVDCTREVHIESDSLDIYWPGPWAWTQWASLSLHHSLCWLHEGGREWLTGQIFTWPISFSHYTLGCFVHSVQCSLQVYSYSL